NPPLCAPPAGAVSPYYKQNPPLWATSPQNPLEPGTSKLLTEGTAVNKQAAYSTILQPEGLCLFSRGF
ncbi:MAG: hypothetical protein ACPGWR_28600, partial [Ardenticatenaceae bacterium]